MAVTTLDGLTAALTNGETISFLKSSATAEGAGTWHSLWAVSGYPGAGAAQGTLNGAVPTDATAGSFPFTNAVGGSNYLGYISASGATAGTLILYDRLWHNSTLNGTLTTAQNITFPGLTRYTNGTGVEVWLEIYSAWGATAATVTVSYTDQDGNAGASGTIAYPTGTPSVGQMIPMTLASGDSGVRAVASATLSVSTGTAGNAGLTMMKRIVTIPIQTLNVAAIGNAFSTGLREIINDACLAFQVQCSTTSTGIISGDLTIAKG